MPNTVKDFVNSLLFIEPAIIYFLGCSIWCTRKYRRTRQIQFILVFKTKTRKTPLCQRQGLRPSAIVGAEDLWEARLSPPSTPTMADSPASNLGADTKEKLENRLSPPKPWKQAVVRCVRWGQRDLLTEKRQQAQPLHHSKSGEVFGNHQEKC